jgi:hypothetical protein
MKLRDLIPTNEYNIPFFAHACIVGRDLESAINFSLESLGCVSRIYSNYIDGTHYKSWRDFSQHASITRHYPLYKMSPFTISYIYVFNQFSVVNMMSLWVTCYKIPVVKENVWSILEWFSQQNYQGSMYNVVCNGLLSWNHFGVSTFPLHLKILLKTFPQQRLRYQHARYHLV